VILPKRIYFTGVPGSRWSGVAQIIETINGMNTTDRWNHKEYEHSEFGGHRGAYFGVGMEYAANCSFTDQAYTSPDAGCMVVKSHEWSTQLKGLQIYHAVPDGDWIMLVYRPDLPSLEWWHQAGGFDITYPNYETYEGPGEMLYQIRRQNAQMLEFAHRENLKWSSFTSDWIAETFGEDSDFDIPEWTDVLVTMYKP